MTRHDEAVVRRVRISSGAPAYDNEIVFGGSRAPHQSCRKQQVGLGVDFADFDKAATQIPVTFA
jgi:hypothetical protein